HLADMLTRSSEAVTNAKGRLARPNITAAEKAQLDAVVSGARPSKQTEAAPPPTLTSVQSDVATLYGQIDRADAAPTRAQINAVNDAAARFETVMKQYSALNK
ncbi:MAG TPA: hypothetical protein VKU62_03790, partial [Thermoanaerobaculia bacterium]|nr:hypothetical protein [Thermoanaerobaculia bacterium]